MWLTNTSHRKEALRLSCQWAGGRDVNSFNRPLSLLWVKSPPEMFITLAEGLFEQLSGLPRGPRSSPRQSQPRASLLPTGKAVGRNPERPRIRS